MLILRAGWVVPVSSPSLRDGAVAVEGGRIVWVGPASHAPAGERRDLGEGVLAPGLVNAHCHLELSHLRGALPGGRFVPWIRALVEQRGESGPVEVRSAQAAAIAELEATGTVAVGDVSNLLEHLDLLEASRLRCVVFYELLGWDPARAYAILGAADARLSALPVSERVEVRLAAHAPHSASPELLRGLVARGGPAAIHLAESPAEMEFLDSGGGEWADFLAWRGLDHVPFEPWGRPVNRLDGLGALRPGLLAAHCVHLDAAERELLARRGVHVVACPRSNRALGNEVPDVPALLSAGVNVALGTDSLASTPNLDLLDEAAALRREFPRLPATSIVRMATLGGAEALGLGDLGCLAVDRQAALAFARAPRVDDPEEFLVSGDAHLAPVPA